MSPESAVNVESGGVWRTSTTNLKMHLSENVMHAKFQWQELPHQEDKKTLKATVKLAHAIAAKGPWR